jgi:transcriptional regulator GlxA family with amidase domain
MTSAAYGQADAFAIAAYISGRRGDASWSGHDVRIATPEGVPVPGYGGFSIEPHCALTEARDSDVILIPPIFNDVEQTLALEASHITWLRSFPKGSALLASTCTGAFFLAEAGILDGRRACARSGSVVPSTPAIEIDRIASFLCPAANGCLGVRDPGR